MESIFSWHSRPTSEPGEAISFALMHPALAGAWGCLCFLLLLLLTGQGLVGKACPPPPQKEKREGGSAGLVNGVGGRGCGKLVMCLEVAKDWWRRGGTGLGAWIGCGCFWGGEQAARRGRRIARLWHLGEGAPGSGGSAHLWWIGLGLVRSTGRVDFEPPTQAQRHLHVKLTVTEP